MPTYLIVREEKYITEYEADSEEEMQAIIDGEGEKHEGMHAKLDKGYEECQTYIDHEVKGDK